MGVIQLPRADALVSAGMTTIDEQVRREERMQLRRLEIASLVEASTLVLLVCVAVPLERLAGDATAVHVMGPVHGRAFLAYLWIALQTVAGGEWLVADRIRLFVGAVVPFGGFFNMRFLSRRAALLR